MKVGILTFCNAYNFGAALQAFSLQKKIEEMGHDAELIDYRCESIEAMHRLKPVFRSRIGFKSRVYNLIYNIVFFPRRKKFKKFHSLSRRSRVYTRDSIKEANGKYDLFITGSDQVFNVNLTGNDTTFFLDFVDKNIKASYAASFGVYLPERRDDYKNNLKSFKYLSVREKSGVEVLNNELGIEAELIPDPVFLHSGEEWKGFFEIKRRTEKYVLIYSLIETKELYEIANKVAKEKGIKIYVLTKVLRPMGRADRVIRNAGPKEFLDYIANAEYVVTNSFHGTAFSLIFEKDFSIYLPPKAQDRIIDLLSFLNLNSCIVLDLNNLTSNSIDYNQIKALTERLGDSGLDYLEKIFSSTGEYYD